jgi:death-on-curing family protein
MNQIEIYQTKDKQTEIEVKLQGNTVWLSQKQIATVFNTEVPAINKHIKNIIKSRELNPNPTISKMEIVQMEGKRKVKRKLELYNLDMIISVGYRVNSLQATRFRIWATQTLKNHLIKGYTLREQRLKELSVNMNQLQQMVSLIQKSGNIQELSATEAKGLLEIITNYTQSFILLNQFDSNKLPDEELNENITYEIKIDEAVHAIEELKKELIKKKETSDLFGKRKDDSFKGILNTVVQTFGKEYLYRSIEEQAAHLLYFIIKNHPFIDGNKRIGAFIFVWFLEKNKHRFKRSGEVKINDNALVALALLVAQSNPNDKDIMIKLIINLIRS